MNTMETAQVLAVIRAGMPGAFIKLTDTDIDAMINMWAEMFADYPQGLVLAAAKTYIWNEQMGRFPSPGAIRKEMQGISKVIQECAYGQSLYEYMRTEAEHYPTQVQAYIDCEARKRHLELFGKTWSSQAEQLGAHIARLQHGKGA